MTVLKKGHKEDKMFGILSSLWPFFPIYVV